MAGSGEEGRDRIHCKRGEDKVKDYRGVTLMSSVYKIYTMVLAERLREEMEWGEASCIIKRNSGKGMGTIDNVFTLNYLINRQLEKERGRLVALFVDLRAAFNSMDRKVLVKAMRERGIREKLTERVAEILKKQKIG